MNGRSVARRPACWVEGAGSVLSTCSQVSGVRYGPTLICYSHSLPYYSPPFPRATHQQLHVPLPEQTRNSSGDEIANVNFLYDDIVHVLQNTIDLCIINSATDRRGYVLERMCLPNSVK